MANDYKRMWTREELEKLAPSSVEYKSPSLNKSLKSKIVVFYNRTQYLRHGIERLLYTVDFNNNIFNEMTINQIFVIDGVVYNKIEIWERNYDRSTVVTYYDVNGTSYIVATRTVSQSISWVDDKYKHNIMCGSGLRWGLTSCIENVRNISTSVEYDELVDIPIDTTELEKATPTDVSIIEDQGKLELMLEHDGNVLAVNDTPNQFLQRRLDKPSAVWTPSNSQTLKEWLNDNWTHVGYIGQYMSVTFETYTGESGVQQTKYGICNFTDFGGPQVHIKPLGIYTTSSTGSDFINEIRLFIPYEKLYVDTTSGNYIELPFSKVTNFKLY